MSPVPTAAALVLVLSQMTCGIMNMKHRDGDAEDLEIDPNALGKVPRDVDIGRGQRREPDHPQKLISAQARAEPPAAHRTPPRACAAPAAACR